MGGCWWSFWRKLLTKTIFFQIDLNEMKQEKAIRFPIQEKAIRFSMMICCWIQGLLRLPDNVLQLKQEYVGDSIPDDDDAVEFKDCCDYSTMIFN